MCLTRTTAAIGKTAATTGSAAIEVNFQQRHRDDVTWGWWQRKAAVMAANKPDFAAKGCLAGQIQLGSARGGRGMRIYLILLQLLAAFGLAHVPVAGALAQGQ